MDILICQACGVILRGKSKFCTGCGATISKFSPTTLPVIAHAAAPLSLSTDPDPLVIERTMNRVKYAGALKGRSDSWSARRTLSEHPTDETGGNGHVDGSGNGHGSGNGNGSGNGDGNGSSTLSAQNDPQSSSVQPQLPWQTTQPSAPTPPSAPGPASKLQNVLGTAAPNRATSSGFEPMLGDALEENAQNKELDHFAPSAEGDAVELTPEEKKEFLMGQGLWAPDPDPVDLLSDRHSAFHDNANFAPPTLPPAAAPANPAPQVTSTSQAFSFSQPGPPSQQALQNSASEPLFGMKSPPQQPLESKEQETDATTSGAIIAPVPAQPTPPDPSSFDFFAAKRKTPQSTSSQLKPSSARGSFSSSAPSDTKTKSFDLNSPEKDTADEIDIPDGVPSVVAKALKAANRAPKNDDYQKTQDEDMAPAPRAASEETMFPDESVNRGKKSRDSSDRPDSSSSDDAQSVRRFRSSINRSDERAAQSPKSFEFGSFSISNTKVVIGILAVFIGIPIVLLIFNLIGSFVLGMAQNGGSALPSLNGRWDMGVLDTKGRTVKNDVMIAQQGMAISGQGMEPGYHFIIQGTYKYPKVEFAKMYVDPNGQPIKDAKPVTFLGQIDWTNPQFGQNTLPAVHMAGMWQLQRRVGYGWRGQIVNLSNKWEAGLIEPASGPPPGMSSQGMAGMPQPTQTVQNNWIMQILGVPPDNSPAKWSMFFMHIVGVLLLLGLVLVFVSLKLFGPAGMINIWAKKEYIPSQYRSQHHKMLREFGKPLKPGGLPLGTRADFNPMKFWLPLKLSVPPEVRAANPHMLILGAGSKGKSRLVASMVAHDIEAGDRAVIVIDSDGNLVDLVLSWMAAHHRGEEMARRVVVIDPTHAGGPPVAYNPLEAPSDGDLQSAASALVYGFKAVYTEPPGAQTQWNQQTADILRNSAILLMANGKTLVDLPVLLSENDFRDVLLEKIERQKDSRAEFTALVESWSRYKRMARTDQWINWIEPILNRVNPMLGSPKIRPILTKPKGDLDLKEIITQNKILLVKVTQGLNAELLGSLLVTGVQQAAQSLSRKNSSPRPQCALYLDEFDTFIEKETFDNITSETKKYRVGLVASSKTLQGLPEDYRNQIIINVGTMCIFALGKKDGDLLGPQMFRVDGRKIKNQTLQNIFNKVNTTPQFELITDEEKLNIDRVVGQEERTFFCYRVGTIAGVFQMKSPDFKDISDKDVNWTLIDRIYARSVKEEE